jgi:hypothetical protein
VKEGVRVVGACLQELADTASLLMLFGEDRLNGLIEYSLQILLSLSGALEVLDGLNLFGQLLTLQPKFWSVTLRRKNKIQAPRTFWVVMGCCPADRSFSRVVGSFLRSNLVPTRIKGTSGQKCINSGYHYTSREGKCFNNQQAQSQAVSSRRTLEVTFS